MSFLTRIVSLFLGISVTFSSFPIRTISQRAKDFRQVAYVVGSSFVDEEKIDTSHFSNLTDVIFIGMSDFNTDGEIVLDTNFEKVLTNLRNAIGNSKAKLHLNLIGPAAKGSFNTWEEQMASQGERHSLAFKSGRLEKNIKDVLEKYDFDGVFFDYEYPVKPEHWEDFDEFLVSLDRFLGDDYIIGSAVSAWHNDQSQKSIDVLDMVEVMSYGIWDEDGTHSSFNLTKSVVNTLLEKGFKKEQLDVGIPFFARPVTQEAYWYDYSGYYDKIDDNGLYYDENNGLTFSFNTYGVVYEKTYWAVMNGLGGAMVWHYSCDLPKENSASLFNAIDSAVNDLSKGRMFKNISGKSC